MADEQESAPRARPFTLPPRPFRGPATTSRPAAAALTPPEAKRASLFVGTRAPAKTAAVPSPAVVSISALAPAPEVAEVIAADSPRSDAIAATEAMPWLFADPGASQPVGSGDANDQPAMELAGVLATHEPPTLEAEPVVFRDPSHDPAPTPGNPHAPGLDVAAVLESIAARVRGGDIDVGFADAASGEASVMATVLAALLRQQGR